MSRFSPEEGSVIENTMVINRVNGVPHLSCTYIETPDIAIPLIHGR